MALLSRFSGILIHIIISINFAGKYIASVDDQGIVKSILKSVNAGLICTKIPEV
jgi:hypothetical protein